MVEQGATCWQGHRIGGGFVEAICIEKDIATFVSHSLQMGTRQQMHRAIGDIHKSQARFKRMHGAMGQLIKLGITQGDVRKDYPLELLIQTVFGSYLYALLTWLTAQEHSLAISLENTAVFLAESISPRAL